jgi:hypothetical protein
VGLLLLDCFGYGFYLSDRLTQPYTGRFTETLCGIAIESS